METRKRMLSLDEQVMHLQAKGVQFTLVGEAAARAYLGQKNNYFRIAAYRKNYPKHPGGAKVGQYVRLEFAYLMDLAELDRLLRDVVLGMALDVEHAARMQIISLTETHGDDEYAIVQDFVDGLDAKERRILDGEIARNRNNIYCGDMVRKYERGYPVWVFVELLSFGKLCSFYRFCADRFEQPEMVKTYYRMRMCQTLRNAAAHGSCILNDLSSNKSTIRTDSVINRALATIPGMSKGFRINKMKNERIQQIVTLLYTYRTMVPDDGGWSLERHKLQGFMKRLRKNQAYYEDNDLLRGVFRFLQMIVDSWYGSGL